MSIRVTNVRVNLSTAGIVDRTDVHRAMAQRYRQIVLGTFGTNGQNRPDYWPDLSRSYVAHNRERNRRTPTYVGKRPTLYRSGALFKSIIATWGPEKGTVSTDNPYALDHQFGVRYRNLPARPFFPFRRDGTPTVFVQQEMTKAALSVLK